MNIYIYIGEKVASSVLLEQNVCETGQREFKSLGACHSFCLMNVCKQVRHLEMQDVLRSSEMGRSLSVAFQDKRNQCGL